MQLKPIGVIFSSYKQRDEAPRQGRLSDEIQELKIYDEFLDGLDGIEESKYIIVLYWQDKSDRQKLKSISPINISKEEKGVFSLRSPNRPNPIAICIAEILEIKKEKILVKGLDALNGSFLIDIKPYVPEIDCVN